MLLLQKNKRLKIMHKIRNNKSVAQINEFGAELKSFAINGNEIIWQSKPEIWDGSAPILFPVVGRLRNQKYIYNGKDYFLSTHGFARDSEFEVESKSENTISFILKSTDETKNVYPFDFLLRVIFSLENDRLSVNYEVENCDSKTMLFSVGSHPAIDLPLENTTLSDYYVEFEQEEYLHRYELIGGLVKKQSKPYLNDEKIIKLTEHIFDDDALIFTNIKSKSINVKNDITDRNIKINLGAPDIGIWAKPNADYVCIEPWYGYDDPVDSNNILGEKPGIQSLKSSKIFRTGYSIEAIKI
jgi:galactose mutarotase-like enzyme